MGLFQFHHRWCFLGICFAMNSHGLMSNVVSLGCYCDSIMASFSLFSGSDHIGNLHEEAVHLVKHSTVGAEVVLVQCLRGSSVSNHHFPILDKYKYLEGKVDGNVDVILHEEGARLGVAKEDQTLLLDELLYLSDCFFKVVFALECLHRCVRCKEDFLVRSRIGVGLRWPNCMSGALWSG